MVSCDEGIFRVAKILVEAGANIDAVNDSGIPVISFATVSGSIDIALYLISKKVRVNYISLYNPLAGAVQHGKLENVKTLLNTGKFDEMSIRLAHYWAKKRKYTNIRRYFEKNYKYLSEY